MVAAAGERCPPPAPTLRGPTFCYRRTVRPTDDLLAVGPRDTVCLKVESQREVTPAKPFRSPFLIRQVVPGQRQILQRQVPLPVAAREGV